MQMRKPLLSAAMSALAVLAVLSVPQAKADDTEIYLTPPTNTGAEPLVMLSLDYRDNLGSSICNNTAVGACTASDYFRAQPGFVASDLPASGTLNFFEMLRLTLKYVLREVSGVQIGLMLNHNNQNNAEGPTHGSGANGSDKKSNGGYIARRFRSLSESGSLDELNAILASMPVPATGGGQSYQGRELFFELYRYLTGGLIYNGHNGWTDYNTNNTHNLDSAADASAPFASTAHDWDTLIETAGNTQYIAPTYQQCTKVFTINFMFLVANQEDDSNAAIAAPTPAGLNLSTRSPDPFSPMLAALRNIDLSSTVTGQQNVTSYFFVDPTKINTTTRRYAASGGTREPFALTADPEKLAEDLRNVFRQILSISTTFVSASIPVNVFNRAEAVDNLYFAVFQAEESPCWNGNVKKLRAKTVQTADGVRTELVDSLNDLNDPTDGDSAFGADGRINFAASTFWSRPSYGGTTPPMQLGDANSDGLLDDPSENPQVDPENVFVGRDGRHVNRGGAGQNVPGFINNTAPGLANSSTTRRVFYDDSSTSLAALNADNATVVANANQLRTALDVATDAEAETLLRYIRGYDVDDVDNNAATTVRPWLMGDPLHSRPVPINYGLIDGHTSKLRPAIFIAVAGNDGMLRFIENTAGGGGAESSANQSGKEVWAFMPRSAMKVQQLLRANAPLTTDSTHPNYDPDFPGRPFSPHPYTLDGSPTVLVKDFNGDGTINNIGGTDQVYLFIGMRRGGRSYYGFNVTDPRNPVLMWTITGGSTSGFAELGRTFSQPKTGRVRLDPDGAGPAPSAVTDVLIFAGGYSNNKDYKALGTDDTVGNALFVVNARTGALIWKATGNNAGQTASATHFVNAAMVDSIPSDVLVVDTDGDPDRLTDRLLVGDTGGNLWRADLGPSNIADTTNWEMWRIAQLGRAETGNNNIANDRRLMHEADLVFDRDSNGPYDGVLIGSGDREDPLDVGGDTLNRFYLIKDRGISVGAPSANSTLTDGGLPDITDVCISGDQAVPCGSPDLANGWKLRLREGPGEKSLAKSLTESGVVYFTTYLKAGSSAEQTCGPSEGNSLLYAVKLANGAPTFDLDLDNDGTNDRDAPPPWTPGTDCVERCRDVTLPGIASTPVYIPPLSDCDELNTSGDPCACGGDILIGGATNPVCKKAPQSTFWRRRED